MKKTLVIILISLFFLSFARGETNNPVLDEALLHLGKPYIYATMGPDTFDCSGFVCYCYKKIENIELQRSAYSQGYDKTYPKIVKIEELKPGDVVFFNTNNSDIDLHIIFDDEDKDHLIRGNKIIDGTRIEYFEKPLSDIYLTIDSDYQNQNNAAVTIFGNSKIIYDKDDNLNKLQQYVMTKFKSPLPPLSDNEAKEQVSIINNRMEKLENYATSNNPYFTHLYHFQS